MSIDFTHVGRAERLPKVSIVVLTFNAAKMFDLLDRCISSLLNTNYSNFEVLLVDNGSEDDSAEKVFANRRAERLRLVKWEHNLGYAGGNNLGFDQVDDRSSFVVFANSDIEVPADWLVDLVDSMTRDERLGACGPVLLEGGRILAGGFYTVSALVVYSDTLPRPGGRYVGFVPGSCLMVRSKLFRDLGGFNTNYFMYSEEIEFCRRLRADGYEVKCIPTKPVLHHGHSTVKATGADASAIYLMTRNRIFFLYQNLRVMQLYEAIVILASASLYDFIGQLRARKPHFISAIFKGLVDGLRQMGRSCSPPGRNPLRDDLQLSLTTDFVQFLPQSRSKHLIKRELTRIIERHNPG